jgi:hypothetical protein
MEKELIEAVKKQIFLEDGSLFSYTIKKVEITNILGAAIAILDEYTITNSSGESYKLYKTNEGNWYDVEDANPDADTFRLMQIKKTINSIINSK